MVANICSLEYNKIQSMNHPNLLSLFYESFHKERRKEGTVAIPERLAFIQNCVGTNKDVIELGCRYGDILSLVANGNRITGVDVDGDAISKCRSRLEGANLLIANLNDTLPFSSGCFDVVILTEVLEHLPYSEITLSEITRILRPGGILVGSVPNATRMRNRLRFLTTGIVELDRTHLKHFSKATLEVLLEKFFSTVETELVGGNLTGFGRDWFANYILFRASIPRNVGICSM